MDRYSTGRYDMIQFSPNCCSASCVGREGLVRTSKTVLCNEVRLGEGDGGKAACFVRFRLSPMYRHHVHACSQAFRDVRRGMAGVGWLMRPRLVVVGTHPSLIRASTKNCHIVSRSFHCINNIK